MRYTTPQKTENSTRKIRIKSRFGYHRNRCIAINILRRLRENDIGWQLGITTPSMIFIDIDEKDMKKAVKNAKILSYLLNEKIYVFITRNGFHLVVPKEYPKLLWRLIYYICYILGIGERLQIRISLRRGLSTLRISERKGLRPILAFSIKKNMFFEELLG